MGQFINKKISAKPFNSLIHEHNLDWSEKEALQPFIETIPNISYNRFLNLISLMHYLLIKEGISIIEHFNLNNQDFNVAKNILLKYGRTMILLTGLY